MNDSNDPENDCSICVGKGYTIDNNGERLKFVQCECSKKQEQKLLIQEANIPERYADWDINSLDDDFRSDNAESHAFIMDYLANLKTNIKNGNGIWLASNTGLAKSSIVSYILRQAISEGHVGYFSRASHLLSKKFEALGDDDARDLIDHIVENVDILAIEEIEKVYLTTGDAMPNHLFYEFLSDIYDSKKTILITSNDSREAVFKRLPGFIGDRLSTLAYLELIGKSGRKRTQKVRPIVS